MFRLRFYKYFQPHLHVLQQFKTSVVLPSVWKTFGAKRNKCCRGPEVLLRAPSLIVSRWKFTSSNNWFVVVVLVFIKMGLNGDRLLALCYRLHFPQRSALLGNWEVHPTRTRSPCGGGCFKFAVRGKKFSLSAQIVYITIKILQKQQSGTEGHLGGIARKLCLVPSLKTPHKGPLWSSRWPRLWLLPLLVKSVGMLCYPFLRVIALRASQEKGLLTDAQSSAEGPGG